MCAHTHEQTYFCCSIRSLSSSACLLSSSSLLSLSSSSSLRLSSSCLCRSLSSSSSRSRSSSSFLGEGTENTWRLNKVMNNTRVVYNPFVNDIWQCHYIPLFCENKVAVILKAFNKNSQLGLKRLNVTCAPKLNAASHLCWLHMGHTEPESVFRYRSRGISLGDIEARHLTFSSPALPARSCAMSCREQRGYSTYWAAWQTPPWPPPSPCFLRRPTLSCRQSVLWVRMEVTLDMVGRREYCASVIN